MKTLRYFLYPALAAALYLLGWGIGGEGFRAYFKGERVEGHVVGMLRLYEEERIDLILGVDQRIELTRADGSKVTAESERDDLVRVVESRTNGEMRVWSAEEIQTLLSAEEPADEAAAADQQLLRDLEDLQRKQRDNMRRYLQRQNDLESDARFVSIIKTETARLFYDLPDYPESYETGDGRIRAIRVNNETLKAEEADTVTTTISFDYIGGTDLAAELKTEVKIENARTRNGEAVENPGDNYIFFTGDFKYVFRPVVSYDVDGTVYAKAAELGARVSPPQNFELDKEILLSYVGDDPSQAVLSPDFSTLKGRPFLDWLNQLFAVLFGRWYIPLVCWVVATVYVIMSLVLVSLYIWPGKTETADLDEGAE